MVVRQIATLSDELKPFIQSGNYEPYTLDLMNKSALVFPGQYEWNEDQSNGQCDFYDVHTLEKFEAKLPFDKKEGQLICSNNANLKDWIEFMMNEEEEFGEKIIRCRGQYKITDLTLYKTLEKRINTVQKDENAVFLFPYPITLDAEGGDGLNLLHFCGDILSNIFSELAKQGVISTRKIYVIYPSLDNKMVLRCLNNHQREYLFSADMKRFFSYEFLPI
ncbi:MAG: hypothetical protein IJC17_00650 [Clostridia bacterium]|nr:hypothetical protein [Clostridia bacterium]